MSQESFTHKELAGLLGVSETTIKSYRRKFPGCFPMANPGKPIRFKEEAKVVALRIRDLFASGMAVEELGKHLTEEFPWFSFTASPKKRKGQSAMEKPGNIASALSNMAKVMLTLTGQQQNILKQLNSIEQTLQLVLKPFNQATQKIELPVVESFPVFSQQMLSFPLVVRADNGTYHSAGGKLGKVSLNQLQNILNQSCPPREHFAMHWEYKDGWQIFFNRNSIAQPVNITLQVAETRSSKNISVLIVRQYWYNSVSRHPMELIPLINPDNPLG